MVSEGGSASSINLVKIRAANFTGIEIIALEKAFQPVLVKFPQTKFTRTTLECQKMLLEVP